MRRVAIFAVFTLAAVLAVSGGFASTGEMESMTARGATVFFDAPRRAAAKTVLAAYPVAFNEVYMAFGWSADIRPSIVIAKDIRAYVDGPVVAYAVPSKNLIVLDAARVVAAPASLLPTLKHEICHLYLAQSVGPMPKWLDEGVCQWISGGVSELLASVGKTSELSRAAMSKGLIPFSDLAKGFPKDERRLVLAYEQSMSFVEFIARELGPDGVMEVLRLMAEGTEVSQAVFEALNVRLQVLEADWTRGLEKRATRFLFLSNNIYVFLFSFAALVTVIGFVRFLIRKRAYRDEEEDEDEEGKPPKALK